MRRRLLPLLLAAVLVLAAGCSTADAQIDQRNAQLYVQGVLDETYTGAASDTYYALTDRTAEDAQETFQANLEAEYSQRLALRFDLEEPFISRSLEEDYLALLDSVYRRTSCTVKSATLLENGRYCVEVSVTPVTFFSAAYVDGYAELRADFAQTHTEPTQEELDKLEPAQARKLRERYGSAWAQAVYDYLYPRLDAITTGPAVTKLLLVSPDSQGLYTISATDLQDLDDLVLQY